MLKAPKVNDGTVSAPERVTVVAGGEEIVRVPATDAPGSELKIWPVRLPATVRLLSVNSTEAFPARLETGRPRPARLTGLSLVPAIRNLTSFVQEPETLTGIFNCGTNSDALKAGTDITPEASRFKRKLALLMLNPRIVKLRGVGR